MKKVIIHKIVCSILMVTFLTAVRFGLTDLLFVVIAFGIVYVIWVFPSQPPRFKIS